MLVWWWFDDITVVSGGIWCYIKRRYWVPAGPTKWPDPRNWWQHRWPVIEMMGRRRRHHRPVAATSPPPSSPSSPLPFFFCCFILPFSFPFSLPAENLTSIWFRLTWSSSRSSFFVFFLHVSYLYWLISILAGSQGTEIEAKPNPNRMSNLEAKAADRWRHRHLPSPSSLRLRILGPSYQRCWTGIQAGGCNW